MKVKFWLEEIPSVIEIKDFPDGVSREYINNKFNEWAISLIEGGWIKLKEGEE